jgi:hypothetical protein
MTAAATRTITHQFWQHETAVIMRIVAMELANNWDKGPWTDIEILPRIAARLKQCYTDAKAFPGDQTVDQMDLLWPGFAQQDPKDTGRIIEAFTTSMLKGHRPDGIDARLGTRPVISTAERPGESFPRLHGFYTGWYGHGEAGASYRD